MDERREPQPVDGASSPSDGTDAPPAPPDASDPEPGPTDAARDAGPASSSRAVATGFQHARADWEEIDRAALAEKSRRIDVPSALGRILGLYLGHIRLFALLGIPGGVVSGLANLLGQSLGVQSGPLPLAVLTVINGVIGLAIIVAADEVRAGRSTSVRVATAAAIRRAGVVAVSSIARYVLMIGVVVLLSILAFVALGATSGGAARAGSPAGIPLPILVAAAVAVGIVVVVGVRWSVADAAIVLEEAGPFESLGRSRGLTARNTIRITGLYLTIGAIVLPLSVGSSLLGAVLDIPLLTVALSVGAGLVTFPIMSITAATIFGDLTGRELAPSAVGPGRPARTAFALGWLAVGVVTLAISVPRFGAVAAQNTLDQVPAADRGRLHAGIARNPVDPCRPLGAKATFASGEPIYIGGYFTRIVPAGQSVEVSFSINGNVLATAPVASTGTLGCYYELEALRGAGTGTYRMVATLGGEIVAEGTFTVQ